MRRVIYNQKGGVGKSSIAVNLSAVSASYGYKTLLVDMDAQCNSSQYLLGKNFETVRISLSDYFAAALEPGYIAKEHDLSSYICTTEYPGLYVLPASKNLRLLETKLTVKHKIYKFRDAIEKFNQQFDAIYIDTPPAFNFYTLSALISTDSVLIPFDCDDFARRALYDLVTDIQETRVDHNPSLRVEGVIINNFQPRAQLPIQLVQELTQEGLPVLGAKLSYSVKMSESHQVAKPLVRMAPTHKLTQEFQHLFAELERMQRKYNKTAAIRH